MYFSGSMSISKEMESFCETHLNEFRSVSRNELDLEELKRNKLLKLVKTALKAPMYQEIYSPELKEKIMDCNNSVVFEEEKNSSYQ
ncbi:hypothetical protein QS257_17480 [Terrilactibacillus sp. S3-3]|nr:hypothetical protein QS257_17480 [Terrilactibacillus sp. S3-3]